MTRKFRPARRHDEPPPKEFRSTRRQDEAPPKGFRSSRRHDAAPPQEIRRDRRPRQEEPVRAANDNATFGVLPVLELLRARSRRIDRIIVADGVREHRLQEVFDLAREHGIRLDRIQRDKLDKLTSNANHQGIVAFSAAADYVEVDEILDAATDQPALIVLLDGVEDPRNLGAILRSVECAGADGVIIPERRAVGLTDTVAKSSAGAIEHVKVAKVANLNRMIEDLKERNIWVVGASGDAKTSHTDWDWTQPSALVLGAEGSGLHRLVAENCDTLVKIPMYGKIDSLNVSVAAGVILFEARRQRSIKE
ncbi:MAG TPA: 23S rRNA (guanosine(2251)-2'-O)-methyltransferase RlmB [Pyrinomonadaceae bacterium]|nr:23S rRNA (guanosine(2251)-2'-O)-methyltransferase RlmB [Pyrinomonadaceae bacterium]